MGTNWPKLSIEIDFHLDVPLIGEVVPLNKPTTNPLELGEPEADLKIKVVGKSKQE